MKKIPLPWHYHLETAKGGHGFLSSIVSKSHHTLEKFGSVQSYSAQYPLSKTISNFFELYSSQLHYTRKEFGWRLVFYKDITFFSLVKLMGWCCPRQQTEPRTPTEHRFNLPPAPHTHPCINPNNYWSKHTYNSLVGSFLFPAVLIFMLFSVGGRCSFFVCFFLNRNILKWYVLIWGRTKCHWTEHLFPPLYSSAA